MIVCHKDITKLENVDAIINAANGYIGCMGAGVAKAIRNAGGKFYYNVKENNIDVRHEAYIIERQSKLLCCRNRYNPGRCFFTTAGNMDYKYVIHAVTMCYPGRRCNLRIVEKCLISIFKMAKKLDCKVIAIPGLGTRNGKLDYDDVAALYMNNIPNLEKYYGIDVVICDLSKKFCNIFNK